MNNERTNSNLPAGHVTVLLDEAVDALEPHPGGVYIDGTFGGGGHSSLILERVGGDATLVAIDADPAAILRATILAESGAGRDVRPVHANFGEMARIAREQGIDRVDGILLDLGLSSFQLDEADRGFAFRFDGPLDMRFDPMTGPSAADLVNSLDEADLADIIWRFGEEKQSRRISRAIVSTRKTRPIETTTELAALVEVALGGRRGKAIHPATKTFQALRIAVNDELVVLQNVLSDAISLLRPGGRIAVISFHSLEDRIVKQTFARESATCICPPDQPVCTCDHSPRLRRIGKPVKPAPGEIDRNPRSRSAIMRVAERMPDVDRNLVESIR
ncbi:MAG TPA: 16S rRNA (cytosine(1402)-N(4))-methyltransferase RsmH [Thermomicrobiales bacterium]|nr:16S rRNA (cytosine(1402)-N(4))-methyltransferase RsmH [Thermomicrobiales bacterium]